MLKHALHAAVAALLLGSGAASAEMHTYQVTATVTYSADASVAVGSKLRASFAYDDANTPWWTSGDSVYYDNYTFLTSTWSGHSASSDLVHVTVRDQADGAFDIVEIYSADPIVVDGALLAEGVFMIHLQTDVDHTDAISGPKMPTTYNMADWSPTRSYGLIQRDPTQTGTIVQFSIDSIETQCLKQNGMVAKKNCWSH